MPVSRVRHVARLATSAALMSGGVALAQPLAAEAGPQVMGWVPAYGIDAASKALATIPGIGQSLTRIGLQFWNPSVDGRGIVLAPQDASGKPVTVAQVRQLQKWARAHGVQPLLTVYNNSQVINRWDWPLAHRAFAEHPEEFIAALVNAVDAYELDGVDVDLEGEGDYGADRAAYAAFIHALAAALKTHGKLLTVDSFHSPCDNAPNMSWWSDWVGSAATIHSMGYADLYEGNAASFTPEGKPVCEGGAALFRYSWQLDYGLRAGYRRDQIVMGMPTWLDSWGSGGLGPTVVDHLHEVRALGAGVGLWDLQLSAPEWGHPATWEAVQALRHPGPVAARHEPHGAFARMLASMRSKFSRTPASAPAAATVAATSASAK